MIGLLSGIGGKIALVILVLAMGWGVLTYIETKAANEYMREYKIESIEKEIEIRKKVDEILEENRASNPDRDGTIALERLRQRYRNPSGSEGD